MNISQLWWHQIDPQTMEFTPLVSAYQVDAAAAKSLQLCPTLCDPMDCSLPGCSIHAIFQARVLEWVATAFSTAYQGIFL